MLIFRMFLLYLILLYSNRRAELTTAMFALTGALAALKWNHFTVRHEHKTRTGQEIKGGLRIKADRNSNRCICCLSVTVSDTLTGCNLCWTVSCPTWWYAELSEHRSNIQSTSACSCFYITDMNLLKFTHIIIHHTDPHTLTEITFCLQTVTGGVGFQPPPVCTSRTWNIYCISGFH